MKNSWTRGFALVGLCLCALLAATTAIGQPFTTVINVPPDPDPGSIGSDTQLNLFDGGSLNLFFDAGDFSVPSTNVQVNILGGEVKSFFDAFSGSTVNVSGGTVGGDFTAYSGSTLNISGGEMILGFRAKTGSTVNITGGDIRYGFSTGDRVIDGGTALVNISGGNIDGNIHAGFHSTINMTGGTVTNSIQAGTNSPFSNNVTVNISGGVVGASPDFSTGFFDGLTANNGSTVNISGGIISAVVAQTGSTINISGGNLGSIGTGFANNMSVTLFGGEFELNGAPVPGLDSIGDSVTLDPAVFNGSLLTSTLADGAVLLTPLTFLDSDLNLTLTAAALPAKQDMINTPTDPAPLGLRAGQTLNLSAGGALNKYFSAVGAELNVTGGSVGDRLQLLDTVATLSEGSVGDDLTALSGSTVNISGGTVGFRFNAETGSTVNISGGTVDRGFNANANSTINITGGDIENVFEAKADSTVNISGGTVGKFFRALAGSNVNFSGGELRLNGVPVPGLESAGDSVNLSLPPDSILTGTLTDGSVFVFSSKFGDRFDGGAATFTAASIPVATSDVIHTPTDPVPPGLRVGQTLNVSDGADLGNNFAAVGATLNIAGGTVGQNLEVLDSVVTISGGSVGGSFTAFPGSTVNISGGTVGSGLGVLSDSTVNISGGNVGPHISAGASDGSSANVTINISGGVVGRSVGNLSANGGSIVNISGGVVSGRLRAFADSTINLSGGSVTSILTADNSSTFNISGGEFFLDGVLVPGLDAVGDSTGVNLPGGSRLTATLADGTVRIFGSLRNDSFADGTLNLISSPLPTAPSIINLPTDPVPRGLRTGQTLNLNTDGDLGQFFTAASVSVVNVNGGSVGRGFIAESDSTININDGAVGRDFVAFTGSTVNIVGGTVGRNFNANSGSTINISGGTVSGDFDAASGSTVNITGGIIGSGFDAFAGSAINLIGFSFVLDGVDLAPGMTPDDIFPITDRDVVLEGVLADGSPFSFDLNSNFSNFLDFFDPNATLTVTLVPEPGSLVLLGVGGLLVMRRGREG
jgi:hypothetical protein